jgi:hypothetical protein
VHSTLQRETPERERSVARSARASLHSSHTDLHSLLAQIVRAQALASGALVVERGAPLSKLERIFEQSAPLRVALRERVPYRSG